MKNNEINVKTIRSEEINYQITSDIYTKIILRIFT